MTTLFVSYTTRDKAWAEWIARELEISGFTTIIDAWDFLPGQNFVVEIDRALQRSDHVVAVLSPSYLEGIYTQAEWAAAFQSGLIGKRSRLIPVMVKKCQPEGLLSPIKHIDISGYLQEKARTLLVSGVWHAVTGSVPRVPSESPFKGNLVEDLGAAFDRVSTSRPDLYSDLRSDRRYVVEQTQAHRDSELKSLQRQAISAPEGGRPSAAESSNSDFPGVGVPPELTARMDKHIGDHFLREELEARKTEFLASRQKADHSRVCLVLLDVDDLTKISKVHGADIGSAVLVRILKIIGHSEGVSDYGRCGDDTYYALLLGFTTNQALRFGKKLCKSVRRFDWQSLSSNLRVTISAGVVRLNDGEPAIDFVVRAAHGFKIAKENGGDRVEHGPVILERESTRELRAYFS